jgi:hypothetical protein
MQLFYRFTGKYLFDELLLIMPLLYNQRLLPRSALDIMSIDYHLPVPVAGNSHRYWSIFKCMAFNWKFIIFVCKQIFFGFCDFFGLCFVLQVQKCCYPHVCVVYECIESRRDDVCQGVVECSTIHNGSVDEASWTHRAAKPWAMDENLESSMC